MVYLRSHLLILLPYWLVFTIGLIFLMTFCQFVSSSASNFDNRALTIVKSIDDYLCQNYVFTCFFRQRYHQSFFQKSNNCKSFSILRSCLHHDADSLRMCHQIILNKIKLELANEMPSSCLTSSAHKTLSMEHQRSIALPRMVIKWQTFVLIFSLFVSFFIGMKTEE